MSPIVASKLAKNMQAMSRERRIAYLEGLLHIWRWRRAMLAKEAA